MNTPTLHQMQRGIQIAEQIAALEAEMSAIFKGDPSLAPAASHVSSSTASHAPKARKKRSKLSPQALANIRAGQKARWAKVKGPKASPKAEAPAPAKKGMSPAHKAKLKAAAKKRWALIKAGKAPNPFKK